MDTIWAALIGAVVGVASALITMKVGYRQIFAETVSSSRNQWLVQMRGYISNMLACKQALLKHNISEEELQKEYYANRNEILLRLNLDEPMHVALKGLISQLDSSTKTKIDDISNKIGDVSRLLLKVEWERVKDEAGGKK